MKQIIYLIAMSTLIQLNAQGYGIFKGKIVDQDFGQPLIGAQIYYLQNQEIIKTSLDDEGRFEFLDLNPGTYNFYVAYWMDTMKITGLKINAGDIINKADLQFSITGIVVTDDRIDMGIIKTDKIEARHIMRSPNKNNLNKVIANLSSTISTNETGESFFKGSRSNGMVYFIDGIKSNSAPSMPAQSLKGITLYSSGLPAQFGDTMGGVVEIHTKSYMELWRERNN